MTLGWRTERWPQWLGQVGGRGAGGSGKHTWDLNVLKDFDIYPKGSHRLI